MKVYTYNFEAGLVVEKEAQRFGYPNPTDDGEKQYENTHFKTFAEAHGALVRELRAGLSLNALELEQTRARVRKLEETAGALSIRLLNAERSAQ